MFSNTGLQIFKVAVLVALTIALPSSVGFKAGIASTVSAAATGRIVFVSKRFDAGGDIFRMASDGTGLQRLTANNTPDECPAVSPNGNWIVYVARKKGEATGGIAGTAPLDVVLMNSDGTSPRAIAHFEEGIAECPVWDSGSTKFLAIETHKWRLEPSPPPNTLHVFTVQGAEASAFNTVARHAEFSPAGDRILLSEVEFDGTVTRNSIVIRKVDGTGREVLRISSQGLAPAWRPGHDEIAYNCAQGWCSMRSDGSGERLLAPFTPDYLTYSPDGEYVAYQCAGRQCVMKAEGYDVVRIEAIASRPRYPSWSPDSGWLAMECERSQPGQFIAHFLQQLRIVGSATNDICIFNRDGSQIINLTSHPAGDESPGYGQ